MLTRSDTETRARWADATIASVDEDISHQQGQTRTAVVMVVAVVAVYV